MINPNLGGWLAGTGGLVGGSMAGIGAFRMFNAFGRKASQMPEAIIKGVEELGKLRMAVENDQSMRTLVVEQGELLKEIREDVHSMKEERDLVGRELRIISRKIEAVNGQD